MSTRTQKGTATLSGELGVIGLFDLGQLLTLNRASGCLAVHSDERKGFLYFVDGRLVNAVDDSFREGEPAAYHVFKWRTGRFEFRLEAPSDGATIDASTESIMLEAARQLDEAGMDGAAEGGGETARLMERQQAMEALREVFQRVAGESGSPVNGTALPVPLEALREAGDCLVLAAGDPVRFRQRGAWTTQGEAALSAAVYEKLRAKFLAACAPADDSVGAPTPRMLTLPGGRSATLDVVEAADSESLWLRPARLAPPDPAKLAGDPDRLMEILRLTRSFIVAGGTDMDGARRLLHALAGALAARRVSSVAVITHDLTYRWPASLAPCMRATPAGLSELVRATHPELVVLDPGLTAGEIRLEDLESVPRVLAGAVGPSLASLAPRLVARLTGGDPARGQAALGAMPLGVVIAGAPVEDGDAIPYSARLLSDTQRVAVLRGDVAGLTAQFAGT